MTRTYEQDWQKLETIIRKDRERITNDLAELLRFQTVSGSKDPEEDKLFRNELARAFSFLNGLAKEMGMQWRNYDNELCVIELPADEGTEVIGLPLHIDVVPAGDGWHYPAFGGMVEDGYIHGRGTQDDKGPIIQMLHAAYALKRLGIPRRRTLRLIIASQEETGRWDDVERYLERETAPDFCIVSDAEFPIVNGEKGMVDLKIDFKWDNSADRPSPLKFCSLKSGDRSNVVPNRADIVFEVSRDQRKAVSETLTGCVGDYLKATPGAETFPLRLDQEASTEMLVTFLGKSAHGSLPQDGHNAAIDALGFAPQVPEIPAAVAKVTQFLNDACRDYFGSALGLAEEHDFLGKTTINIGVVNIGTDSATATINVRPTWGITCEGVLEAAQKAVAAWAGSNPEITATVEFSGKPHPPLYINPDEYPELIAALQESFRRVTGDEPELEAMGGTTFAKAFPNALCFGPVYPKQEKLLFHQADERIQVDHLMRNVEVYGLALMLLAT